VLDTLWEDAAYDFNGWLYRDSVTNAVVGAMGYRNGPYSVWFTEGYRSLQKAIDKLFPGQVVRIRGTNAAGKLVLIGSFSDRQPEIYSWVDLEKKTAGAFRNSRPWIDAQRMQPMSIMKFKTRDGKSFDACVTLPKGVSKQTPAPLVVLPHGRVGHDAWGFTEEVQFLASRGYAVLQPNFRGSSGQRWMYPTSDEWEFFKMHEDVTDAVKTLFATGLIDRNRVAIVGTTDFGGYLALCGVAFEPQLYRCAVTQSAVYDWGELIQDQEYFKYQGNFFSRYSIKLGDPKKNPEKFAAMSPLKHARDIRVPVLVSYGEYEISSQIGLAKEIVSTVRSKGLEAETLSFRDERSGLNYFDHKIEFYQKMESFLAKNMGATAP